MIYRTRILQSNRRAPSTPKNPTRPKSRRLHSQRSPSQELLPERSPPLIPPLSRAQLTPLGVRNQMGLSPTIAFITLNLTKIPPRSSALPKSPHPRISLPHIRSTRTSPLLLPLRPAPLIPAPLGLIQSRAQITFLASAMLLLAPGTLLWPTTLAMLMGSSRFPLPSPGFSL